jgi:hypothetical protein
MMYVLYRVWNSICLAIQEAKIQLQGELKPLKANLAWLITMSKAEAYYQITGDQLVGDSILGVPWPRKER